MPTANREVTAQDLQTLEQQLERVPRGCIEIPTRCVCGRPLVVSTKPRLDDGTPFPTMYYLTCPPVVRAVSTLEATGVMEEMNQRLRASLAAAPGEEAAQLANAYREAHEDYLRRRAKLGQVPEIEGISAGGMPTRVKCLHALVGHALAAGPGVNPFGDEALEAISQWWVPTRCTCV